MISEAIREEDYRIAGSVVGWIDPGEYGPLSDGCCLVSLECDPLGPRLLLLMQRKESEPHSHEVSEWTCQP